MGEILEIKMSRVAFYLSYRRRNKINDASIGFSEKNIPAYGFQLYKRTPVIQLFLNP